MADQEIIKRHRKVNKKIEIGDRFTRLKVLENVGIRKGKTHYLCECECGNIVSVSIARLNSGHTKSCGCLRKDIVFIHGMTGTPEHRTWYHMKNRCYNPNNKAFKRYGRRGITVCSEWKDSFMAFYKDLGPKPKGLTIERIDNNGNYEPGNVKWATYVKQNRNKRLSKTNTSGVKGVCWIKKRYKYHVSISVNKKRLFIGYFATIEKAKAARTKSEQKYWR